MFELSSPLDALLAHQVDDRYAHSVTGSDSGRNRMPIMSAYEQSDARGAAVVLARAAQRSLDGKVGGGTTVPSLNNLYRMLEDFRAHEFRGYAYEARSDRGPESLSLLPKSDRRVSDLRLALSAALDENYRNRESGIKEIEDLLKAIVRAEAPVVDPEKRTRVQAFLKTFISKLSKRDT